MKSYLTIIVFFLFFKGLAQDNVISISFQNEKLKTAFSRIEALTDYQFYFIDDWVDGKLVSGEFSNASLQEVLDLILEGTLLNRYVLDNKHIVITKNNVIYDELPENFFGEADGTIVQSEIDEENLEVAAPVFYKDLNAVKKISVETVRIGKADRNNSRSKFTLTGVVTNGTNGGPIANLSLVLKSSGVGTATDANGNFSLRLPAGVNLIEAKSLGFETIHKRVIVYNDGSLNFTLNESLEDLTEVVIQANVDRNVKEASAGNTKINVKEIKNIPLVLGERDIFKVATTLPGISSAGEGATGFNVRGGKTDQNLVLLDDAVIYNPSHFFGIFSAINPFTSSEVNIYKGNIPAKYGGRLSSVFDIKTKNANVEKFSGEASIGPVTSNAVLELPISKGKGGILVGGRSTYSNWILRSLDEEELQKSQASFYDIIAKVNQKIGKKDEVKITGYYSRDAYSITSDSLNKYSNRLVSLRWNRTFNEKNEASLLVSNTGYKFDIAFDGQTNTDFDLGYSIDESQLGLQFKYSPNESHAISYGASTKLYNVEPGEINPANATSIITPVKIKKERALESGIFISDEFMVNEKLTLDVGLRYSFYQAMGPSSQRVYADGLPKAEGTLIEIRDFGNNKTIKAYSNPEVRASARYFILPDFSLKASFNNNTQYIHSLSNNTTASPTDTWKLSDLNIKPQEATQYSLGFYKNFEDNIFEASVEGYYKKIDDVLDYKIGSQTLLNETIETDVLQGDGRAYGIELLLKKTSGRLNGWLGYTYSKSETRLNSDFIEERVNNGNYFPSNYDKPHDISLVANYKITRRYSISTNFVYQTGRPVTVPVGNFVVNGTELVLYSDRNQYRIPDYYRLDIGVNIEGNHKIKKFAHSFWNISIYNVLGKNNPYSVFFVSDNGEVKAYQSSIFSVPVPTITYNFRF